MGEGTSVGLQVQEPLPLLSATGLSPPRPASQFEGKANSLAGEGADQTGGVADGARPGRAVRSGEKSNRRGAPRHAPLEARWRTGSQMREEST